MTETTLRELLDDAFEAGHMAYPAPDLARKKKLRDYVVTNILARAALADHGRPETTPAEIGETSDGYHTFNELYAYRKAYNALLFNVWVARGLYDVHKSVLHSDGEPCFGGGWFVVSAQTPAGQITNHYKMTDWELFHVPERTRASVWDGHTPTVALERLMMLAAHPPVVAAVPEGPQDEKWPCVFRSVEGAAFCGTHWVNLEHKGQGAGWLCRVGGAVIPYGSPFGTVVRPPVADSVRQELCICAAIQFADGRIVRGHRHDACFRTAEGWTPKPELHGHVQGFVTSHNRFVDRKEGWRLMSMTGGHSAHTGLAFAGQADGELFSEDLYFDSHDHAVWNTPYVEPADSVRAPQATEEPTGWWCACGHPNGINLAVCACCSRAPGGPDNPVQTIYRATPLSDSVRASTDEIAQSWAVLGKSYQDRYGSLPDAIRALGEALKASEAVNWQEHDAMKRQMRKDIERELAASSASAEPSTWTDAEYQALATKAAGYEADREYNANLVAERDHEIARLKTLVRAEPPAQKGK